LSWRASAPLYLQSAVSLAAASFGDSRNRRAISVLVSTMSAVNLQSADGGEDFVGSQKHPNGKRHKSGTILPLLDNGRSQIKSWETALLTVSRFELIDTRIDHDFPLPLGPSEQRR
jgi:hypothetical protein